MQELLDYLQRVTFWLLHHKHGRVSSPTVPAWATLNYRKRRPVDVYIEDVFIASVVLQSVSIYYLGERRILHDAVYADQLVMDIPVRIAQQIHEACTKEAAIQLKVAGLPALIGTLYMYSNFFENPRSDPDQEAHADITFTAVWEELQDPKLRYLFVQGLHELAERKRKPSERIA